jgi:hypothetical protein
VGDAQLEPAFGVGPRPRQFLRRLRTRRPQGHGGIGDGSASTENFPFEFLGRERRPSQQETGDSKC